MKELEAVNLILEASGNGGYVVSSLNPDDARSEASKALRRLTFESKAIQARGWYFNTRCRIDLTPDAVTGEISLPAGVISIDSEGGDSWREVTQVGRKLYDLFENTESFSAVLRVGYVLIYTFECVPDPIAFWIQAEAALSYYKNFPTRDVLRLRTLADDRDKYRAQAKKFDADSRDCNVLRTTEAQRILGFPVPGPLSGYPLNFGVW